VNAFVAEKLGKAFLSANNHLRVVLCEKYRWLPDKNGDKMNFKAPDMLFSYTGLYTKKGASVALQQGYAVEGSFENRVLFDMIVGIAEGKKDEVNEEAFGELVDYVRLLRLCTKRQELFPTMLFGSKEIWLVLFNCDYPAFISKYKWDTPGSVAAVIKFFGNSSYRSKWQIALESACFSQGVVLADENAFLGSGAHGRVFSVYKTGNPHLRMALKIVLLSSYAEECRFNNEFNLLDCYSSSNLFVQVVQNSFNITKGMGSYLMSNVGCRIDKSNSAHQKGILAALQLLHEHGHYHGDARGPNIVLLCDNRFAWIDPAQKYTDKNTCQQEDLMSLLHSLFGGDVSNRAQDIILDSHHGSVVGINYITFVKQLLGPQCQF
jgi:hypothetical protein